MNIGHDTPCPCGSGKKHENCRDGKNDRSVDVSGNLSGCRLGEAHDRLLDHLRKHAETTFGKESLTEASVEFLLWPEEDDIRDALGNHEPLFYPWFFFNWVYEPEKMNEKLQGPAHTTVAESYATAKGNRLDSLESRLIQATVGEPFSFWEVLDRKPDCGYRLTDLFRGDVCDVPGKIGSQNPNKGDILFGRMVKIDAAATLMGCGTILIPPEMKSGLIQFKTWLIEANGPITTDTLNEFDIEFREAYFDIFDAVTQPPELRNIDPADNEKRRPTKASGKVERKKHAKKRKDDRQLKLFNDAKE